MHGVITPNPKPQTPNPKTLKEVRGFALVSKRDFKKPTIAIFIKPLHRYACYYITGGIELYINA